MPPQDEPLTLTPEQRAVYEAYLRGDISLEALLDRPEWHGYRDHARAEIVAKLHTPNPFLRALLNR